MRITINIEDQAHALLKEYAREHKISMGQALSVLVKRGAQSILTSQEAAKALASLGGTQPDLAPIPRRRFL
jgi:hypothetical protein